MSKTKTSKKKEPDWHTIASVMYNRLEWLLSQPYKFGNSFTRSTGKFQSVRDVIADDMEKWPGIKVNREASKALELPPKARRAYFAKLSAEEKKDSSK